MLREALGVIKILEVPRFEPPGTAIRKMHFRVTVSGLCRGARDDRAVGEFRHNEGTRVGTGINRAVQKAYDVASVCEILGVRRFRQGRYLQRVNPSEIAFRRLNTPPAVFFQEFHRGAHHGFRHDFRRKRVFAVNGGHGDADEAD